MRWLGIGALLTTAEIGPLRSCAPGGGGKSSRPAGFVSAGFRAEPSRMVRLTVSTTNRKRIPIEMHARPAALRFGSIKGRRVRPRSSKQRASQSNVPTKSHT